MPAGGREGEGEGACAYMFMRLYVSVLICSCDYYCTNVHLDDKKKKNKITCGSQVGTRRDENTKNTKGPPMKPICAKCRLPRAGSQGCQCPIGDCPRCYRPIYVTTGHPKYGKLCFRCTIEVRREEQNQPNQLDLFNEEKTIKPKLKRLEFSGREEEIGQINTLLTTLQRGRSKTETILKALSKMAKEKRRSRSYRKKKRTERAIEQEFKDEERRRGIEDA